MFQLKLIPRLTKSFSRTRLNTMRAQKKIEESLRTNKYLEQYNKKNNLFHKRNISAPFKKIEKRAKNIHDLDEKFEKRFNKVDENMEVMNINIGIMSLNMGEMNTKMGEMNTKMGEMNTKMGQMNTNMGIMNTSINSILLLSLLKENIPKGNEKEKIIDYIEGQYKKLLPEILKESPVNNNEEDEKEIIPKQNDNNIIIQKKPAIKYEINKNIQNINNNNAFKRFNDYNKNPFSNISLNNDDNSKAKKKFTLRKKSLQFKSNSSSGQNSISFGNSIN